MSRTIVEIVPNRSRIVKMLLKFCRIVVELTSNCLDLLSKFTQVDVELSRIVFQLMSNYRINVQIFSNCYRFDHVLFNFFVESLSNCWNFVEILSNCYRILQLLSIFCRTFINLFKLCRIFLELSPIVVEIFSKYVELLSNFLSNCCRIFVNFFSNWRIVELLSNYGITVDNYMHR